MNGEVALDTLNIHFAIPLVNKGGIGLPLSLAMAYNSSGWGTGLVGGVGTQWLPGNFWTMPAVDSSSFAGTLLGSTVECNGIQPYVYRTSWWGYRDPDGNLHSFPTGGGLIPNTTPGLDLCPVTTNPEAGTFPDGSGLTMSVYTSGGGGYVTTPGGIVYSPSFNTIADPKGNKLSLSSGVITDTLGVRKLL